jgi:hypothetical protein
MGEKTGAYGVLVGRTEGRRPLGIPRRGWKDNTKTDLEEVRWAVITLSIGTVAKRF